MSEGVNRTLLGKMSPSLLHAASTAMHPMTISLIGSISESRNLRPRRISVAREADVGARPIGEALK
jgi:hypothetical protein